MKRIKTITIAVMATLAISNIALAQAEKLPAPIQSAVDSGLKFEKSFQAQGGMTGWVLSQGPNNNMVLFTPPNGEVAIAGNMFDASGVNLTKQYLEKHAPKPDYEKMWGELETSAWVAEGPKSKDAKSYIYVFEDANCGYCNLAAKAFRPYIAAGLQVRWVPVAFLAADSLPKAAALLTATNPAIAIEEMHANFGKKMQNPPAVDPAIKAKIENNAKLMKQYGFAGTPAIFYKDKNGKVRAVNGMPSLSELPAITGLPEQKITDPALARYQ